MFCGIDTSQFMPHGHCILWKAELLIPIVVSDVMIFLSYTSIPLALYIFTKKRKDLSKNSKQVLILFFLFIQLCGITHIISAYNYWHSQYVLEMFFKVGTALVSTLTAIALFKLLPKLLKLPSPEEHEKLIAELKELNSDLTERTIRKRHKIEEQNTLLESLIQGQKVAVMRYFPKFNDQKEIIDFSNEIVFGDPSREAGLEEKNDIITSSLLETFPESKTNGFFTTLVDTYQNFTRSEKDPVFFNDRYFRVVCFHEASKDSVLVLFNDVTAREEEKLKTINNSKLISLGELAGSVAHEINTPLQVITGNTRKIKRNIENPSDKVLEAISAITETVERVSSIVINLKRLSRNDESSIEDCCVENLIKKTVSFYEQRFKLSEIELKVDYLINKQSTVKVNEVSFFQILNNLFSNAVDALKELESERHLYVSVSRENEKVHFTISNNGPKVPEELKNRIFDPLFTTKEIGKGTGLGLSLSKRFANDMGGDLILIQDDLVRFQLTLGVSD